MPEHAIVTGGAGFAGSSLCVALRRTFPHLRVTAFDNLKRRGSELNLPRLREAGVQFVHGDIRSLGDLLALPEADLLIECSAEPSAQAGYGGSADYLIHTNLTGCYHCLELARRTRANFLFVSTSRVYPYTTLNQLAYEEQETRFALRDKQSVAGVSAAGIREEFPLDGPRSLYGMTKLAAELLVEEFADAYGFRYVIDRFGVLTGPHQMAKADQGVIALWAAAHYFRRPLAYIGFGGTGKQVRDFLHIDDFCDLVLDQVAHFGEYQGRRWNIGGGLNFSLSLRETTSVCEEVTGNRIAMGSQPDNRPADVRIYLTDHSRVSAIRGWQPRRDARQTVADLTGWLHREEAVLQPILYG